MITYIPTPMMFKEITGTIKKFSRINKTITIKLNTDFWQASQFKDAKIVLKIPIPKEYWSRELDKKN